MQLKPIPMKNILETDSVCGSCGEGRGENCGGVVLRLGGVEMRAVAGEARDGYFVPM